MRAAGKQVIAKWEKLNQFPFHPPLAPTSHLFVYPTDSDHCLLQDCWLGSVQVSTALQGCECCELTCPEDSSAHTAHLSTPLLSVLLPYLWSGAGLTRVFLLGVSPQQTLSLFSALDSSECLLACKDGLLQPRLRECQSMGLRIST